MKEQHWAYRMTSKHSARRWHFSPAIDSLIFICIRRAAVSRRIVEFHGNSLTGPRQITLLCHRLIPHHLSRSIFLQTIFGQIAETIAWRGQRSWGNVPLKITTISSQRAARRFYVQMYTGLTKVIGTVATFLSTDFRRVGDETFAAWRMSASHLTITTPDGTTEMLDGADHRLKHSTQLVAKASTTDAMQNDVGNGIEHVEENEKIVILLEIFRTIITGGNISFAIDQCQ